MIKISTKFNDLNAEGLKADKKLLFFAGLICGGLCLAGAAAGGIFINPICWSLAAGAIVILITVLICFRRLNALSALRDRHPYSLISLDDTGISIEKIDPLSMARRKAEIYALNGAEVRRASDGKSFSLRIPTDDQNRPTVYSFNIAGFVSGSPEELQELFKRA